nr:hypothetical protein BaRGS_025735 [Batillaria attramentaria]
MSRAFVRARGKQFLFTFGWCADLDFPRRGTLPKPLLPAGGPWNLSEVPPDWKDPQRRQLPSSMNHGSGFRGNNQHKYE